MASGVRENQYKKLSNEMLDTTFGIPKLGPDERQERLHQQSSQMGALLLSGEGDTSLTSCEAIKGAAMLACMPCLTELAANKTPTWGTACEVSDNLRHLIGELIRAGFPDKQDPSTSLGTASEIGALSSIWLAIELGLFREGSYVHPTRSTTDIAVRTKKGRTGFDLRFKDNAHRPKEYAVQVKSSPCKTKRYIPGIVKFVPAKTLIGGGCGSDGTDRLLKTLVEAPPNTLWSMAEKTKGIFSSHHEEFPAKLLSRY